MQSADEQPNREMTSSSSSRAFLKCTHVPSNKTDHIHLEDEANRRLTVSEVDVAVRNNLLKVYLSKDKYRALAAYIDSLHLRKVCLWTILVYAFATVAETSICITSSMTLQDKMNYLKLIMTLFNVLEQYSPVSEPFPFCLVPQMFRFLDSRSPYTHSQVQGELLRWERRRCIRMVY